MNNAINTKISLVLMAIMLGGCSSGGGSSDSSTYPSQTKQIDSLKNQIHSKNQEVKELQDRFSKSQQKIKEYEEAKRLAENNLSKAQKDLAIAQQALKDAKLKTEQEQTKIQKNAEKASQDLIIAQKALTEVKLAFDTEQAKTQKSAQELSKAQKMLTETQSALKIEQGKVQKAVQDLSIAENALTNAKLEITEEQSKTQKAKQDLENAQKKIESLETELEPVRAEIERKRRVAQEEAKKWAFLKENGAWRHIEKEERLNGYAEHANIDGKAFYLYPIGAYENIVLQKGIDFSKHPISNDKQVLPVTATRQSILGTLQTLNVANVHFINQKYSTYLNWSYQDRINDDLLRRNAGYVALPTSQNSDFLKTPMVVTYNGKALGITSYTEDTQNVYSGDFSLSADFKSENVTGRITNLNSQNYELLSGKINVSEQGNLTFSGKLDNNLDYKGVFAGPNAEEVVGQAGTDISFGGKR